MIIMHQRASPPRFNLRPAPGAVFAIGAIAALMGTQSFATRAQTAAAGQACRPQSQVVAVPELPEASGIAVSLKDANRLWAHNDSGAAELFALDTRGGVVGRLRLTGASVEDWEAVAVAPCPAGSCVYVGDIGDNEARRKRVTLYRFAEPAPSEQSVAVKEVFHGTYPDGAHDAETLLATPDGTIFIVTKGETGPVGLYRFPKDLKSGATHQLERVGQARAKGAASPEERITDGDVSSDGQWVTLRTRQHLSFHRAADLLAGNWKETRRVDLKPFGEEQGEGVAIAGGTVYLAGEGGGKERPGTFVRFNCAPNW
jgi:hypothetical protein